MKIITPSSSEKKQFESTMRVTTCLLVLAGAIVMVYGEKCHVPGDCTHVACPEHDFSIDCHQQQCTCSHNQATCSAPADCHHVFPCDRDWHCIDGRCACGLGFGGGPVGGGPGGPAPVGK